MNMKTCCVPNCNKTRTVNTVLHRFPNPDKDPDRFKTWVNAIGGDLLSLDSYYIHRNRRICHIHFESQYHTRSLRISCNSVPTFHLSGSIVILHVFPNPDKEPDRFRTWLYAIGGDILALDNQKIFKYRRVCHDHFDSRYYTASKRLIHNAVPTLHLKGSHKTLHGFPNPVTNLERFRTWVYAVGGDILKLKNEYIYKYRRVCHAHFEERFCCRFNKLSNIATPTLHMPGISVHKFMAVEQQRLFQNLEGCDKHKGQAGGDTGSKDFLLDHTYCLNEGEKWAPDIGDLAKEYSKLYKNTTAESKTDAIDKPCEIVGIDKPCEIVGIDKPCEIVGIDKPCEIAGIDETCEIVGVDEPCEIVGIDELFDVTADDYDDDSVPNTPVPELPQQIFSWEKTDAIITDDTEVVSDETVKAPEPELTLELEDVSMYDDEQPSKDNNTDEECTEYRCNECGVIIKGFRYTCVQCADWDLCAACEARAAHAAHYVLRVPGARPYKEIQAVLAAIRHQILSENLFLPEIIASIKEEVKDEEAEAAERAPEPEPDPLGAWDGSEHDDGCDTLENYPERNDEDGRPPRKRRRTSLDPFANTQNLTRDDSSYNNLVTVTDDSDDGLDTNKDDSLSDDGQTCDSRFDYSKPIKIIDIDKLTKTHERTEQHYEQEDSDVIRNTKENLTEMSLGICETLRNASLDTSKPKRQTLIDMNSLRTPLKTLIVSKHASYTHDETHSELIATHRKEIGTDGKIIETHNEGIGTFTKGAHSKTKIGTHSKEIGTHSKGIETHCTGLGTHSKGVGTLSTEIGTHSKRIETHSIGLGTHSKGIKTHSVGLGTHSTEIGTHSKSIATLSKETGTRSLLKTAGKAKKSYKILLPPGAHWIELLETMLKSQATVKLEDVTQKKSVPKNTEINEI